MTKLKIIHVGPAHVPGTSTQRARAFVDLEHDVERIFTSLPGHNPRTFYHRIRKKMGYPLELNSENASLIAMVNKIKPDIVWIEKGLTIKPSTIRSIKKEFPTTLIISFSPDDMVNNPNNQSSYYISCLPLYDVHVTTKTHNISELLAMGALNVEFMPKSYDPHTHRPVHLSDKDVENYASSVSFVGTFERERAQSMARIAQNGIPIRVWGALWERFSASPGITLEKKEIFGDEYAKAICAAKINLGFLSKINHDKQTARSIEIPACGAFLLAERTDEHLDLFREGIEAEFFSTDEELIGKIHYYLENENERLAIAKAGLKRCIESGYSNQERLAVILERCCNSLHLQG